MRMFRLTRRFAMSAALVTLVGSMTMLGQTAAKESPATDCLVQLNGSKTGAAGSGTPLTATTTCTDCDPACDADSDNSTPNGQCSFRVQACVNAVSSDCTAKDLKKAKVNPKSAGVLIAPNGSSSVCGAFTSVVVKTKRKGKKAGKIKLVASAVANGRPKASDKDVALLTCTPRPAGEACPTTSTTTTTVVTTSSTSTTSTTLPTTLCVGGGPNSTLEGAEECDDGNRVDTDGCTNNCTTCGNGTVKVPEQCDDGNRIDGDGCDANCTITACGNGVVSTGETCDPGATTDTCTGGKTCMPTGTISECTCKSCTALTPTKTLNFRTGTGVARYCGDAGLGTGSDGTSYGMVLAKDTNNGDVTLPLGAGCLYIGGGNSTVPGGIVPDGSLSRFNVTQDCEGEMVLAPALGDSTTCTKGAGPGKACINDLTPWPNLQTCTVDADCPHTGSPAGATATKSCVDKPNCLFGPPLPIVNGTLSTCVVNSLGIDASGSVVATSGSARINLPLRSHTFLTGDPNEPCPTCKSDGKCSAGSRIGLTCSQTDLGTVRTTIECPPSATMPALGQYLPEFNVSLAPLSTGTTSKTSAAGLFCTPQKTFSAFGAEAAGFRGTDLLKVVEIRQTGVPAGDLTDGLVKPVTLGAVFCIPATGDGLIDGAADLPGPGAISLPGTFQLLQ